MIRSLLASALALVVSSSSWAQSSGTEGPALTPAILDLQMKRAIETINSDAPFTYEASRARRAERSGVAQGYWINVDTRDAEACKEVYVSVRNLRSNMGNSSYEEFCRVDARNPMVSVLVFQDVNAQEFRRSLNLSGLKTTDQNMVTDTRNLAMTMVGTMGLLWLLPESVTKWNKEQIKNSKSGIFGEYVDNVRKGPVVDKDDPFVNYIGHPLSGAAYYTMARHNNLSMMQSFGYSVVMSTFFWEYGFEAFAEVPSIQDLIVTPVIGSLLGELFYRAEQNIVANGGKLAGSKKLGKLAMVVLNPMGAISSSVNRALGSKVVQGAQADWVVRHEERNGMVVNAIGVQFRFLFY